MERYGIVVLPLYVILEGREYADRAEISTEEVYACMRRGIVPKTSQVSYTDTEATLRKHLKVGEDLIYIGFSTRMSGTFRLVAGIMSELQEEYKARRITACRNFFHYPPVSFVIRSLVSARPNKNGFFHYNV